MINNYVSILVISNTSVDERQYEMKPDPKPVLNRYMP